MENNKPAALLSLRIVYFALLAGMLMFAAITYLIGLNQPPVMPDVEMRKNFFLGVLAVAAICLTAASVLSERDLKKIADNGNLQQQFEKYRAISIRTYALFEAPAMLAIICYFLTQQSQLFIIIAIIIVRYLVEIPSARKIAERLKVSEEELKSL